jgi:site-specific DNA-methyltransferase (adenine-specific)
MKNEFINADSLQTLVGMPDQSIDVVLTDPPYPNYQGLFPDDVADGYAGLYLASKKAKQYVIFFLSPRFPVPTPPPGWWLIAQHVWHKPDATANTRYEHIIVWSRERTRKTSKVFTVPILEYRTLSDWQPHPTQKPLKLLRVLLAIYTNEGETVMDPFARSGSTAVACLQMKRNYLIMEKDPKYTEVIKRRIEQRGLHEYNERPNPDDHPAPEDEKEPVQEDEDHSRTPEHKRKQGKK